MKGKLLAFATGFLAIALLAGCLAPSTPPTTGSGNIVAEITKVQGFREVEISHAFAAVISQDDAFGVVVHIDDNLVDYLHVVKLQNTLTIGLDPDHRYALENATLEAWVSMPTLTDIKLSGASNVTITGFESTKALDVTLSGASYLWGDIQAGNVRFDVSGGSQVSLVGAGQKANFVASGNSVLNLGGFPINNANIVARGGSSVTAYVNGKLDAAASGASHILYRGSPTLGKVDTSGYSSVSPQ